MSTLKVSAINNEAAISGGLAIDANGNVSGAGMDRIVSQTFSAVSSVSVDDCFSSDYDDYMVHILASCTAATDASIRLRASGVDDTAGNYTYQFLSANGGGLAGSRAGGTSAWRVGTVDSVPSNMELSLMRPALALRTRGFILFGSAYATVTIENSVYDHSAAAAFDGFTLYSASGTLTGGIRVYGLRN